MGLFSRGPEKVIACAVICVLMLIGGAVMYVATGGSTTVTCVGEGSRLLLDRYAVASDHRAAKIVAFVIIGVGVVLGVVGGWLIKIGWKGRTVVERVPV